MSDNVEVRFVWSLLAGDQSEQSVKFRDHFLRIASDTRITDLGNGDIGVQIWCDAYNVEHHKDYRFDYLRKNFGLRTIFMDRDACEHNFPMDSINDKMLEHDNDLLSEVNGWDGLKYRPDDKDTTKDTDKDTAILVLAKMAEYRKDRKPPKLVDPTSLLPNSFEKPKPAKDLTKQLSSNSSLSTEPTNDSKQQTQLPPTPPPPIPTVEIPADDDDSKSCVDSTSLRPDSFEKPKPAKDLTKELSSDSSLSTEKKRLDYSFWDKKKPLPLGCDIALTKDLLAKINVGNFVPAKQRVGLYCGRDNVGKTSWLVQLAAWLSKAGTYVLYVSTDQDSEDIVPYANGFGCDRRYFHVRSFKNDELQIDDMRKLIDDFTHDFGHQPDLLILDSLADITIESADGFMPSNAKGETRDFNEYRAADWKIAFSRFINPLAINHDVAILGSLHSTHEGEMNEHAVPFSHRLPGLVEFCFMIFDKDVNPKGAWNKDLVATLKAQSTDTRLLFCRQTRSSNKRRSYFYDLGDEIVGQEVGQHDCVRNIINVREAVSESAASTHPAHSNDIKTIDDVCNCVANKAGGHGPTFKISEMNALKALNCYDKSDSQAPDAEQRRELYSKAKRGGLIEFEESHKGVTVWVAVGDKIDDEAWRTHGGQYDD